MVVPRLTEAAYMHGGVGIALHACVGLSRQTACSVQACTVWTIRGCSH